MNTVFDSKAAQHYTGVSVRQINHWDALGLVRPSVKPASGTGSRRLYSSHDLLLLMAARSLRDAGVSLAGIQCVLAAVHGNLNRVRAGQPAWLVAADTEEVHAAANETEVVRLAGGARVALVIGLSRLAADLRHRLAMAGEARPADATGSVQGAAGRGRPTGAPKDDKRVAEVQPNAKPSPATTPARKTGASVWGGGW